MMGWIILQGRDAPIGELRHCSMDFSRLFDTLQLDTATLGPHESFCTLVGADVGEIAQWSAHGFGCLKSADSTDSYAMALHG
jgi:hypothetical protein